MNLPQAFLERINKNYPDEANKLIHSISNTQAPVSIRINSKKINPNIQFNGKVIDWNNKGRFLDKRPVFTLDPLYHAGVYYAQEASSMILEKVLEKIELNNDFLALDLCAAPGGKSLILSDWLANNGLLISNEVIAARAKILKENCIKWGCNNVLVSNSDPKKIAKSGVNFDLILIDAPCSGEGLFRKDPDSINEWSEENTHLCELRQKRIIADIITQLNENGYLIYSTCTYNPAENEEQLLWMEQEFQLEWQNMDELLTYGMIKKGQGYAFLAQENFGEGFYIALGKLTQKNLGSHKNKTEFKAFKNSKLKNIKAPKSYELLESKDLQIFIPQGKKEIFNQLLNSGIYFINAGIWLDSNLNPSFEQCMIPDFIEDLPKYELQISYALKYLKGEPVFDENWNNGWAIMSYKNVNLGPIKKMDKRSNNYFPAEYRIRMELKNEEELLLNNSIIYQ